MDNRRDPGVVAQVEEAMQAAVVPDRVLDRSLADTDPEVHRAISAELTRQQATLEMIASENFAPVAVMQAQGSVLTNKYAEGYPGRRYYGGCEHVDVIEQLAIDRLKARFGAEYANLQPHSGAQANAAAMAALLHPGHRRPREEVQLLGVPRPAGRPARTRDRRQGRRLQAGRRARLRRAAGAHAGRRPAARRTAAGTGLPRGRRQRGQRRHRRPPGARGPAGVPLDGRQAEDRLHAIGITVNRNA